MDCSLAKAAAFSFVPNNISASGSTARAFLPCLWAASKQISRFLQQRSRIQSHSSVRAKMMTFSKSSTLHCQCGNRSWNHRHRRGCIILITVREARRRSSCLSNRVHLCESSDSDWPDWKSWTGRASSECKACHELGRCCRCRSRTSQRSSPSWPEHWANFWRRWRHPLAPALTCLLPINSISQVQSKLFVANICKLGVSQSSLFSILPKNSPIYYVAL